MIRITTLLLALLALNSCGADDKKDPVTDTDVATAFIRATLDNDLKTAEKFILPDTVNLQYFATFKRQYRQKNKTELDKFKTAEVVIDELKPENDSVHTLIYSNTYTNKKDKLKLVWKNNKWLVDFKYTVTATP